MVKSPHVVSLIHRCPLSKKIKAKHYAPKKHCLKLKIIVRYCTFFHPKNKVKEPTIKYRALYLALPSPPPTPPACVGTDAGTTFYTERRKTRREVGKMNTLVFYAFNCK